MIGLWSIGSCYLRIYITQTVPQRALCLFQVGFPQRRYSIGIDHYVFNIDMFLALQIVYRERCIRTVVPVAQVFEFSDLAVAEHGQISSSYQRVSIRYTAHLEPASSVAWQPTRSINNVYKRPSNNLLWYCRHFILDMKYSTVCFVNRIFHH